MEMSTCRVDTPLDEQELTVQLPSPGRIVLIDQVEI
jgi:hypothetical protein